MTESVEKAAKLRLSSREMHNKCNEFQKNRLQKGLWKISVENCVEIVTACRLRQGRSPASSEQAVP
jgi:hypothetical protein